MDFLDYYRENLTYLRDLGGEFANEFPKIAGRLDLTKFDCADPYVERLLEGTAFLSARVEKRLDDGYKYFLEAVLASVSPEILTPIVSGAVVQLNVDYASEEVRAGNLLDDVIVGEAHIPTMTTACKFSSVSPIYLSPVYVSAAEYITRDLANFDIESRTAVSGIHLDLGLPNANEIKKIKANNLTLYINASDATASMIMRQMLSDLEGIYYSNGDGFKLLKNAKIKVNSFEDIELLLSETKGNMYGIHMLKKFLSYPSFLKFITIENIGDIFKAGSGQIELLFTFKRRESELAQEIRTATFKTNCVPMINAFKKRSERLNLAKDQFELHIVPEQMSPQDYEVYSIQKMEFYDAQNKELFDATSFFNHEDDEKLKYNFYSVHRSRSLFDQKEKQRSSYAGTEVFVSVSGQNADMQDVAQYLAEMICSNRDLPLFLQQSTPLTFEIPFVKSGEFLTKPSRPNYPLIDRGNKADWAKVSHILLNFSGVLWKNGTIPLELLKSLLSSYVLRSADECKRMVEGIVSLTSEPQTFRYNKNGTVFFETGWKIQFTLNETAYAGVGFYLYGLVLINIFKSFTPLNSLLEIEFRTTQSGLIGTWRTLNNM
ncbi:MAG: type VI secretion system baseplate subunit TssF [Alphaproteobacteria bacterium]|nr:type VI secretion system baseplate subunit TssF [Alphaproteobacteria bacterium]